MVKERAEDAADRRPHDRNPRVAPVGASLPRNRQDRMRDAGADWNLFTIGFYRDLKHYAESADGYEAMITVRV